MKTSIFIHSVYALGWFNITLCDAIMIDAFKDFCSRDILRDSWTAQENFSRKLAALSTFWLPKLLQKYPNDFTRNCRRLVSRERHFSVRLRLELILHHLAEPKPGSSRFEPSSSQARASKSSCLKPSLNSSLSSRVGILLPLCLQNISSQV